MKRCSTLLTIFLAYIINAQQLNINSNAIQRLLNRINAQNQDNARAVIANQIQPIKSNQDNEANQNNAGNANSIVIVNQATPTVLDPTKIDQGNHDAVIGPASLAQRVGEFALTTTTFQPTAIIGAENGVNTNIPVDLRGDFFSTRFAECEELQCGNARQECCIDNIRAFCCNRADPDAEEGRFGAGAIGAIATVGGVTPIIAVGPIARLVAPNFLTTTTLTPFQNLQLSLLDVGQICFVDADCAFGLICEIDTQCLIASQFRNFGFRRGRRRGRRNRLRRLGFGTICHKICTVGFR